MGLIKKQALLVILLSLFSCKVQPEEEQSVLFSIEDEKIILAGLKDVLPARPFGPKGKHSDFVWIKSVFYPTYLAEQSYSKNEELLAFNKPLKDSTFHVTFFDSLEVISIERLDSLVQVEPFGLVETFKNFFEIDYNGYIQFSKPLIKKDSAWFYARWRYGKAGWISEFICVKDSINWRFESYDELINF